MGEEMRFFFSISYNAQNEPVLITVFVRVKFVDKRKRFGDSVFKLRFPFKKKLENILSINALACGLPSPWYWNFKSNGFSGLTSFCRLVVFSRFLTKYFNA